jgi:hypothetical protein
LKQSTYFYTALLMILFKFLFLYEIYNLQYLHISQEQ